MRLHKLSLPVILCVVCISSQAVPAQVRLPRLISDSMVLQRDINLNIGGWAKAGEKIKIHFTGKTYRTKANADGKWQIMLLPLKAGGPYDMQIDAGNHITIKNILIDDVWLCSGQSNMVHQMQLHSIRYTNEIASANYPEIRQFWIPATTDLQKPKDDLPAGSWKTANPEDVLQFSAVAYFFAKKIYEKYHVPVGLINSGVGGSPIEAWISEDGLKEFPSVINTIEKNKDTAYFNSLIKNNPQDDAGKIQQNDSGLMQATPWYDTSYIPKKWRTINIPGYWEDQGIKNLDGVVWYRREIDLPPSAAGVPAKVFLGRIVDADFLYINGKLAGNTTYQYPQRRYKVPDGLLKPGKNIFVVRVINNSGKGGFVPDKPYCLIAGNDTIDLKGYWQYKVGEVFAPSEQQRISIQNQPAALYNAMIAPLINFPVKGFLWYQGESNTGRAKEYTALQQALITDWRKKWGEEDAPFLYVQLPNFGDMQYLPAESDWAELREAQLKTLIVPNTGMVVAIDLGEWNDVHPDRKKEVGERLALAAEKVAYGEKDIAYSGPVYQSAAINENKIIVSFTNTGSCLVTNDGGQPAEFAIAGADKKFVWAKTKIENNKVIVWSEMISKPMYVRYAWADNPVNPNLYNKEGLPASPFTTE